MFKKIFSICSFILLMSQVNIMATTTSQTLSKDKDYNNTGVVESVNDNELTYLNELDKEKTNQMNKQKEYRVRSNSISTYSYSSSKINYIGNAIQYNSISCGPTTLYNVVYGYDVGNYGSYCTYLNGTLRTPYSYQEPVGFTANGTPFGSKFVNALNTFAPNNNYTLKSGYGTDSEWASTFKDSVQWTISKDNGYKKRNYAVVVNQSKSNNYTGIHPIYTSNSSHFYAIYGYSNNGDTVYISDSNPKLNTNNNKYTASSYIAARDCKNRGFIW